MGKRSQQNQAFSARLLHGLNPSKLRRAQKVRLARGFRAGGLGVPSIPSAMGPSVTAGVSNGGGNTGCCPDGGLPTLPTQPIQYDPCLGKFWSNTTDNLTSSLISYQRSPLTEQTNWNVNTNVATALGTNALAANRIDGLIFWMPGIANVNLSGFVTITVTGFTWEVGPGAVVQDYTETFNLIPAQNNGPVLFGYVFRDANNQQVTLRSQAAGVVATTVGPANVSIAAQAVTVTVGAGWPAAAAPVQVFPFNSRDTWVKPYTDFFAQEVG